MPPHAEPAPECDQPAGPMESEMHYNAIDAEPSQPVRSQSGALAGMGAEDAPEHPRADNDRDDTASVSVPSGWAYERDEAVVMATVEATISALAASLEARFIRAGSTLTTMLENIDSMIAALDEVTNALGPDEAGRAIANLTEVANRLTGLPAVGAIRGESLSQIDDCTRGIREGAWRIRDVLRGLRIFSLSIKIAASDDPIFLSLSQDILKRVEAGEEELAALTQSLSTLERDITQAEEAEKLLAAEVRKAVPAAPRQLASEADGLKNYQGSAVRSAAHVASVARSIQGKVAAVLGALQIGDITRQRLEHVATGLAMLSARMAQTDGGAEDVAALKGAVIPLLVAQLSDAGTDFGQQSRILAESLQGVALDAGELSRLNVRDEPGEDPTQMLSRLESGISKVAQLTRQLCATDAQLDNMSREIVATVDELGSFLRMLRRLRADVEHIAINTGIRCYRAGSEGQAVAVIAVEVRSYVGQLDIIINSVSTYLDRLNQASEGLRQQDGGAGDGNGANEMLEQSLIAIRGACDQAKQSVTMAERGSGQVADMLASTSNDVGMEQEIGGAIEDVLAQIAATGAMAFLPADEAHPAAEALLEQIAKLYTMARERDIHRGYVHRPSSEAPMLEIVETELALAAEPESDDDLFDDVLF